MMSNMCPKKAKSAVAEIDSLYDDARDNEKSSVPISNLCNKPTISKRPTQAIP